MVNKLSKKRSWTDEDLKEAVELSFSVRMVIQKLKLVPAGGNYDHINRRIKDLNIDISHFTGKGWNTGERKRGAMVPAVPIEELLVKNSQVQSFKLKKRLFALNLKQPKCEICGWSKMFVDGRIPVELDHINGDRFDNRLGNLHILCPNCHSLQTTHRGKNKKVKLRLQ